MIEVVISYTFFNFGYAIVYSIVALAQVSKYDLKPLKLTGILGLVYYKFNLYYSICKKIL
jgi:hypothetical protein